VGNRETRRAESNPFYSISRSIMHDTWQTNNNKINMQSHLSKVDTKPGKNSLLSYLTHYYRPNLIWLQWVSWIQPATSHPISNKRLLLVPLQANIRLDSTGHGRYFLITTKAGARGRVVDWGTTLKAGR
jgi:hypothetical protein